MPSRPFRAKFGGHCGHCTKRYETGDLIVRTDVIYYWYVPGKYGAISTELHYNGRVFRGRSLMRKVRSQYAHKACSDRHSARQEAQEDAERSGNHRRGAGTTDQ